MSRLELSHNNSRKIWGGLHIAGWLLASGIATGFFLDSVTDAYATKTQLDNEIGALMDKAGYWTTLGDMNGPDQYDQPLEKAKEERQEHTDDMMLYFAGGVGAASIGAGGAYWAVRNFRRISEP